MRSLCLYQVFFLELDYPIVIWYNYPPRNWLTHCLLDTIKLRRLARLKEIVEVIEA